MHFQAFAGRMIETAHEFMALTWKVLPFFLIGAIAGVRCTPHPTTVSRGDRQGNHALVS